MVRHLLAAILVAVAAAACGGGDTTPEVRPISPTTPAPSGSRLATFGGGCFWCAEAIFSRLDGVISVESGFSGGTLANPTYERVCDGDTNHAEVIQVRYDPAKVTYEQLLEVFWKTHDPTTPNRQGADVGTQYRSIVLWHDDEQRKTAESVKGALDESGAFAKPIVTEIVKYEHFWKADEHHEAYFARNPNAGYCRAVIAPKVEKFEKVFQDRLKKR